MPDTRGKQKHYFKWKAGLKDSVPRPKSLKRERFDRAFYRSLPADKNVLRARLKQKQPGSFRSPAAQIAYFAAA